MKIIFISIDTLRSDHLGCYGHDYTKNPVSPFIDSLAEKGVVFERHYATDVPTPPSYTSMFFGVRAIKNGIYRFRHYSREFTCRTPSIADYFYRGGHRTGMISNLPLIYGWVHAGFLDIHKTANRFQGGRAEEVTDEALRWLKEHGQNDFFLFVHYWDPHVSYFLRSQEKYRSMFSPGEYRALAPSMKYFDMNPDIREAYREKHVRTQDPQEPEGNLALYDANIRYADDNICRLVDSLSSLDIDKDEILFVITSDHGEAFGEYGFWDHYSAYRNVGQVPLIFRGPGIEKGRVPGYTQHVDILPTLCDMAGYEIQGSICGKSMTGLLEDKTGAFRDEAICESAFVAIQRMYIKDEYALVHTMHRQGRSHIKEYELFDLRNDRDQVNDISKEKPELAGEYRIAMEDWVSREAGGSAQDKLKYMAYRRDRIPEAFLLDERHY